MEKVSSNLVSACSVSPHPVHGQSRPEHRAEVPLVVREILQITGGVLVEDKCPRGLTEESVDRIRRGLELETDQPACSMMKWRGLPFYLPGRELCPGRRKASSVLPLLLPCHFSCVYRNCERKLHLENNLPPFSSSFLMKSQEDSVCNPFPQLVMIEIIFNQSLVKQPLLCVHCSTDAP